MSDSRWIDVGSGWHPLLDELDKNIRTLIPEYKIFQYKEKFGTLRFYVDFTDATSDSYTIKEAYDLISQAENASASICEFCGGEGSLIKIRGWYKTMCGECTDGVETSH